MSASLVGSEMCIRDRPVGVPSQGVQEHTRTCPKGCYPCTLPAVERPVSYTHLTLPTICSV
eukprot:3744257-Alexandrium_andersonii.AAC.1